MFTKNNVSQSLVDAVKNIIGEAGPVKEPTATGVKVYGRSYGNSAKAKQDQTKSSVDDLKGPKTKDLLQKDKEDHMKTKGRYDEELKGDQHKIDANKNKKIDAHDFTILRGKKKVAEELKGDQHKIDANKNNKVDAHDFAILRGKKKVKEDMHFAKKLIEGIKRSDIPASVRKARGDAPLTPAEVKSGSKDSISDPKNLAKARNEEIEQIDEKDPCWSNYTQVGMKKKNGRDVPNCVPSKGVPAAKGYKKEEVELTEGIEVKKEYDDKKESEHGVYHNGKKIGYIVHNKKHDTHTAYHSPQGDPEDNDYGQIDDFHSHHKAVSQIRHSAGVGIHEEIELDERTMTSADKTERERIVKGMKKGLAGFKSRYGKDAKSVMYATATKQAMKEGAEDSSAITTDTLIGRMPGGKSNDFKSYKIRVRPLDKEGEHQPKDATPIAIQPDDTPARKSHETTSSLKLKEGKRPETDDAPPFEGPYTKVPSDVKDKSGAVHTPMSRARNLAKAAMKKLKTEMLGKLGTSESKK
jgi:hypothetical protein